MNRETDPQKYFGTREIKGVIPKHFVKCQTNMSNESYVWVVKKFVGRFGVSIDLNPSYLSFDSNHKIYFEDPKEAMIYELRWSGSN